MHPASLPSLRSPTHGDAPGMFATRDYPATVFAFRKFAPTPHSQAARSSRVLLSVAAQIEADPERRSSFSQR
jgi:hypothetical protein